MGITLDSTDDGGSVTLVLNHILADTYFVISREDLPHKAIPGASTATVDTDTPVLFPRQFEFDARVTPTEKTSLETLLSERKDIDLSDGYLSNINTRIGFLSFRGGPSEGTPFIASVKLKEV